MSHSHGGFLKGSLSLETSRSCTPPTSYALAYRAIAQLRPISDYRTAPTNAHTKPPVSSIHFDESPRWMGAELAWAAVLFERVAVDLTPKPTFSFLAEKPSEECRSASPMPAATSSSPSRRQTLPTLLS